MLPDIADITLSEQELYSLCYDEYAALAYIDSCPDGIAYDKIKMLENDKINLAFPMLGLRDLIETFTPPDDDGQMHYRISRHGKKALGMHQEPMRPAVNTTEKPKHPHRIQSHQTAYIREDISYKELNDAKHARIDLGKHLVSLVEATVSRLEALEAAFYACDKTHLGKQICICRHELEEQANYVACEEQMLADSGCGA